LAAGHPGAGQGHGDGHGVDLPPPGLLGQVPPVSAREPGAAHPHHGLAQGLQAPGRPLVRPLPSPGQHRLPGDPDGAVLPDSHPHGPHPAVVGGRRPAIEEMETGTGLRVHYPGGRHPGERYGEPVLSPNLGGRACLPAAGGRPIFLGRPVAADGGGDAPEIIFFKVLDVPLEHEGLVPK